MALHRNSLNNNFSIINNTKAKLKPQYKVSTHNVVLSLDALRFTRNPIKSPVNTHISEYY
jgi:hypothetical protein